MLSFGQVYLPIAGGAASGHGRPARRVLALLTSLGIACAGPGLRAQQSPAELGQQAYDYTAPNLQPGQTGPAVSVSGADGQPPASPTSIGTTGQPPALRPTQNVNLGGWMFDVTGFFEVEFNDNINYSNANRESDIILRPGMSLSSSYRLSKFNTLTLGLGISWAQYLFHPSLSSYNNFANISPDSELALNFRIDNVNVKIYDAFSYSVQPSDAVAINPANGQIITSISQYARFTNQAGFQADWPMTENIILYGGFYRYDVFPQQSDMAYTRRWQYTAELGLRHLVNKEWTVGLAASYTRNYYQQNYDNNSIAWYVGPTATYTPDENWSFSLNLGYIFYDFLPTGTVGDTSQPSTWVGSFTITNQTTENLQQNLEFSRSSSYGYTSNTIDVNRVAYNLGWQFKPDWQFKFWAYWEHGVNSGGPSPETYHKWSVSPGVDYTLNRRTTLYAFYEYTLKDSNLPGRTYNRNRIVIGVKYDF